MSTFLELSKLFDRDLDDKNVDNLFREIAQCSKATESDINKINHTLGPIRLELSIIEQFSDKQLRSQSKTVEYKIRNFIKEIKFLKRCIRNKNQLISKILEKLEIHCKVAEESYEKVKYKDVGGEGVSTQTTDGKLFYTNLIKAKRLITNLTDNANKLIRKVKKVEFDLLLMHNKIKSCNQNNLILNNNYSERNSKKSDTSKPRLDGDEIKSDINLEDEKNKYLNEIRLKEEERKRLKALHEAERIKEEYLRINEKQKTKEIDEEIIERMQKEKHVSKMCLEIQKLFEQSDQNEIKNKYKTNINEDKIENMKETKKMENSQTETEKSFFASNRDSPKKVNRGINSNIMLKEPIKSVKPSARKVPKSTFIRKKPLKNIPIKIEKEKNDELNGNKKVSIVLKADEFQKENPNSQEEKEIVETSNITENPDSHEQKEIVKISKDKLKQIKGYKCCEKTKIDERPIILKIDNENTPEDETTILEKSPEDEIQKNVEIPNNKQDAPITVQKSVKESNLTSTKNIKKISPPMKRNINERNQKNRINKKPPLRTPNTKYKNLPKNNEKILRKYPNKAHLKDATKRDMKKIREKSRKSEIPEKSKLKEEKKIETAIDNKANDDSPRKESVERPLINNKSTCCHKIDTDKEKKERENKTSEKNIKTSGTQKDERLLLKDTNKLGSDDLNNAPVKDDKINVVTNKKDKGFICCREFNEIENKKKDNLNKHISTENQYDERSLETNNLILISKSKEDSDNYSIKELHQESSIPTDVSEKSAQIPKMSCCKPMSRKIMPNDLEKQSEIEIDDPQPKTSTKSKVETQKVNEPFQNSILLSEKSENINCINFCRSHKLKELTSQPNNEYEFNNTNLQIIITKPNDSEIVKTENYKPSKESGADKKLVIATKIPDKESADNKQNKCHHKNCICCQLIPFIRPEKSKSKDSNIEDQPFPLYQKQEIKQKPSGSKNALLTNKNREKIHSKKSVNPPSVESRTDNSQLDTVEIDDQNNVESNKQEDNALKRKMKCTCCKCETGEKSRKIQSPNKSKHSETEQVLSETDKRPGEKERKIPQQVDGQLTAVDKKEKEKSILTCSKCCTSVIEPNEEKSSNDKLTEVTDKHKERDLTKPCSSFICSKCCTTAFKSKDETSQKIVTNVNDMQQEITDQNTEKDLHTHSIISSENTFQKQEESLKDNKKNNFVKKSTTLKNEEESSDKYQEKITKEHEENYFKKCNDIFVCSKCCTGVTEPKDKISQKPEESLEASKKTNFTEENTILEKEIDSNDKKRKITLKNEEKSIKKCNDLFVCSKCCTSEKLMDKREDNKSELLNEKTDLDEKQQEIYHQNKEKYLNGNETPTHSIIPNEKTLYKVIEKDNKKEDVTDVNTKAHSCAPASCFKCYTEVHESKEDTTLKKEEGSDNKQEEVTSKNQGKSFQKCNDLFLCSKCCLSQNPKERQEGDRNELTNKETDLIKTKDIMDMKGKTEKSGLEGNQQESSHRDKEKDLKIKDVLDRAIISNDKTSQENVTYVNTKAHSHVPLTCSKCCIEVNEPKENTNLKKLEGLDDKEEVTYENKVKHFKKCNDLFVCSKCCTSQKPKDSQEYDKNELKNKEADLKKAKDIINPETREKSGLDDRQQGIIQQDKEKNLIKNDSVSVSEAKNKITQKPPKSSDDYQIEDSEKNREKYFKTCQDIFKGSKCCTRTNQSKKETTPRKSTQNLDDKSKISMDKEETKPIKTNSDNTKIKYNKHGITDTNKSEKTNPKNSEVELTSKAPDVRNKAKKCNEMFVCYKCAEKPKDDKIEEKSQNVKREQSDKRSNVESSSVDKKLDDTLISKEKEKISDKKSLQYIVCTKCTKTSNASENENSKNSEPNTMPKNIDEPKKTSSELKSNDIDQRSTNISGHERKIKKCNELFVCSKSAEMLITKQEANKNMKRDEPDQKPKAESKSIDKPLRDVKELPNMTPLSENSKLKTVQPNKITESADKNKEVNNMQNSKSYICCKTENKNKTSQVASETKLIEKNISPDKNIVSLNKNSTAENKTSNEKDDKTNVEKESFCSVCRRTKIIDKSKNPEKSSLEIDNKKSPENLSKDRINPCPYCKTETAAIQLETLDKDSRDQNNTPMKINLQAKNKENEAERKLIPKENQVSQTESKKDNESKQIILKESDGKGKDIILEKDVNGKKSLCCQKTTVDDTDENLIVLTDKTKFEKMGQPQYVSKLDGITKPESSQKLDADGSQTDPDIQKANKTELDTKPDNTLNMTEIIDSQTLKEKAVVDNDKHPDPSEKDIKISDENENDYDEISNLSNKQTVKTSCCRKKNEKNSQKYNKKEMEKLIAENNQQDQERLERETSLCRKLREQEEKNYIKNDVKNEEKNAQFKQEELADKKLKQYIRLKQLEEQRLYFKAEYEEEERLREEMRLIEKSKADAYYLSQLQQRSQQHKLPICFDKNGGNNFNFSKNNISENGKRLLKIEYSIKKLKESINKPKSEELSENDSLNSINGRFNYDNISFDPMKPNRTSRMANVKIKTIPQNCNDNNRTEDEVDINKNNNEDNEKDVREKCHINYKRKPQKENKNENKKSLPAPENKDDAANESNKKSKENNLNDVAPKSSCCGGNSTKITKENPNNSNESNNVITKTKDVIDIFSNENNNENEQSKDIREKCHIHYKRKSKKQNDEETKTVENQKTKSSLVQSVNKKPSENEQNNLAPKSPCCGCGSTKVSKEISPIPISESHIEPSKEKSLNTDLEGLDRNKNNDSLDVREKCHMSHKRKSKSAEETKVHNEDFEEEEELSYQSPIAKPEEKIEKDIALKKSCCGKESTKVTKETSPNEEKEITENDEQTNTESNLEYEKEDITQFDYEDEHISKSQLLQSDNESKPSILYAEEHLKKQISNKDGNQESSKNADFDLKTPTKAKKRSGRKSNKKQYELFEEDFGSFQETPDSTEVEDSYKDIEDEEDIQGNIHMTDEDFTIPLDDPNNFRYWPTYIYWVKPENSYSKKMGCILKAKPGGIGRHTHFECTSIYSSRILPNIDLQEDAASIPIEIKPRESAQEFNFENPWKLILPHILPKNSPKDPVILMLNDDETGWIEMPTSEIILDDLKEHKLRFVETKLEKSSGVFIVQTKNRTDNGIINKHGARIASTMDSRVFVSVPAGAIRITLNTTLKINTVDSSFWKELKGKFDKSPLEQVICSSHLIAFTSKKKKLIKPAIISCHLPLNVEVKKQQEVQPKTTLAKKKDRADDDEDDDNADKQNKSFTPKIEMNAFQKSLLMSGITGANANENIKVMVYSNEEDKWNEMEKPEISTDKTKEQMSLEFPTIQSTKFFMLRANRTITFENLTKAVKLIETEFSLRNSLIILMKSVKNPYEFLLLTCLKSRSEKIISQFKEEGYNVEPQNTPVSIELKERQILRTCFSGNIQNINANKNTMFFAYQSLFLNIQIFRTKPIDTYAQRAIDHYRGYIMVFTKKLMKKPIESTDKKGRKGNVQYQMVEEDFMICQLLISIPKKRLIAHKPLRNIPFNREILEDFLCIFTRIADGIGISWKELGTSLKISESRLQMLKHHNPGNQPGKIVIQMLLFWLKGLELRDDKPEMLRQALLEANRNDLAVMMRESTDDDDSSLSASDS